MKLLENIERKVNAKLNIFFDRIKKKAQNRAHLPEKKKIKLPDFLINLKNIILKIYNYIKKFISNFIGFFSNTKRNIQAGLERIITVTQSIDVDSVKPKVIFAGLIGIITLVLTRVKAFFIGLKPITIVTSAAVITTSSLLGINVYQSYKEVQETKDLRDPAMVAKVLEESARPKYYKEDERTFIIRNIRVPIPHGMPSKTVRSLIVDVTVISSNRYIKQYFEQNMHFIEDKINSYVEPMDPSFSLQDEGKRILKEKLKLEINSLIQDLEIEGQINSVHIDSIIAG